MQLSFIFMKNIQPNNFTKHMATQPFLMSLMMLAFAMPQSAYAYIGPGAGLSAIGTAVAFLIALIFLIVGFVWYPVKRFLKRRKSAETEKDTDVSN